MELAVSAEPVRTKDWNWDMILNVAGNRGTVNNLLQGMELLYVTDVQIGGAKAASVDGGKFMALTGYAWNRDDNGNVILDGATGMPTHSSDATRYIGDREPTFSGGFSNNVRYKNWNLSVMLDFRVGGLIYNGTDYYMTTYGMSKRTENRDKIVIEGVVADSDGKYIPKTFIYEAGKTYQVGDAERTGEYMIQQYYSDFYTKEASNFSTKTNWLRLRGISLSYSIPGTALAKTKFIKGCTFSLAGDNLLVWTNYKGLDPENSVAGSGVTGSSSTGIDYCGVPSTASMSFGVNLKF